MLATTESIPAVAYLRRSTDRQEQSIGDQRKEIQSWAREREYEIVREYVDDAISGTSAGDRPEFQRMIAEARRGEFKAILVWASDRFSRADVTETEYYRFLLREAGVKLVSVTENFIDTEGIEGDVLRTVRQCQNRQYSVSLAQNTLRGQLSSINARSDPGRAAPYGYDREVLAPDGSMLFRIRFCPGGLREMYDKDCKLQARYAKGENLKKPGKQCRARLVLSDPDRVQTVKDIFRMFLDGVGFASIAADLNAQGVPAPSRNLWGHTSIKAILANPTYKGDLVWNRRTEAKFFRVQKGRAEKRQRANGESKVVRTSKDDWVVVPNAVPAIISTEDWEKAQTILAKRNKCRGGAGHRNRRWLLTGVLKCGDCGHKFWGDPRRKGRVEGQAPIVTSYYSCAGRRSHGKTICRTPSGLRSEKLESWVLDKLHDIVLADEEAVETAIERFVETTAVKKPGLTDEARIARELKEIDAAVTALTMHIDLANISLLNDRLTQLRLRKEHLEEERRNLQQSAQSQDVGALRKWARAQLTGLRDAMVGTRNDKTREVIGTYIERITVWPSKKKGEMMLNPAAYALWKDHDRPSRRSWANKVGATGFEPATS